MNLFTDTHFLLQILQNLGKADKTTDEIFEEHLQNFNTQQVNATRLHKDINNYLRCIRGQYFVRNIPFLDQWSEAVFYCFPVSRCHAVCNASTPR